MTTAQIARVLREAAMWSHFADYPHGPLHAINCYMFNMSFANWQAVNAEFESRFGIRRDWTREITILALLFAAEAVESE